MADPFAAPPVDPAHPDLHPADQGQPLAQLRAALTRLAGCALPDPARQALAEAELALSALEAIAPDPVDKTVFAALLEMAGPELAPELTAQMAADLRATLAALAQGLAQADRAMVGAQSHVLVSLAGAGGARRLELGAQALNRAALGGDAARMRALGPGVLAGLAALIGFVEGAADGKP
ncbi:MAG: hypothetical protein Q7J44_16850 [Pseudotabrizicola sp.]|uniref:hypothetical protein n=1 Tax=Pseudotabrizicola sp. TaxID=2939647 RepID=UPI00271D1750|nr:hypothetical protein [Pseudotabrizicola sp.]MDO9640208.1 hypothetical protein [Pseudotabrizicola sp.]